MTRSRAFGLIAVWWLGCQAQQPDGVAYLADALEQGEAPRVLVVSPEGSGSACSAAEPCALAQARALLPELASAAQADTIVELTGGVYRLSEPLRFGPSDSGQNGHAVVWRARAGEHPVLSGALRIQGFSLEDSARNLWRAAVPPTLRTRQLYIDEQRVPVAQGAPPVPMSGDYTGYTAQDASYGRWRNPGQLEFVWVGGSGPWTEPRCRVAAISGQHIQLSEPCWSNTVARPALLPPASGPYNMSPNNPPTRIENAFELMQPGQYYLDEARHVLYYQAAADGFDPNQSDVEAPQLEQLLIAEGTLDSPVHDLVLSGLTFAYATWHRPSTSVGFAEVQANQTMTTGPEAPPEGLCEFSNPRGSCPLGAFTGEPAAVSITFADRVQLLRNRFAHLGAAGVSLARGSHADVVEGNVFHDISGNGLQLGDANDPHPVDVQLDTRETCTNIRVANNLIYDVGQEFHGAVGLLLFFGQHIQLVHNVIHDVPYTAISSGVLNGHVNTPITPDLTTNVNRDNEISYNLIYRFQRVLGDGGALYLEGHQNETPRLPDGGIDTEAGFAHGLTVRGNVAYAAGAYGNTFYDDIGSQWITLQGNVQWQGWSGHGGCLPVGHIRVIDNYHSDTIGDFGCGEPLDVQFERNVQLPRHPGVWDLPLDSLRTAGLEAPFRDLEAVRPPQLEYASPAEGRARSGTEVLIAGAGFGPGTRAQWGAQAASATEVLSSNFLRATAPEGAELSLLSVATESGLAQLRVDDTDPGIAYQGDWKPLSEPGCYDFTLHRAQLDGSFFSYTFSGTGIELIADADRNLAAPEVYVDGRAQPSAPCTAPSRTQQQVCVRVAGLERASHSLKVVKRGGVELTVDALRIVP